MADVPDLTRDERARGGRARAASLSPIERTEIAREAALARWGRSVLTATHAGEIHIGESVLNCAVLEDGTRLLNQSTFLEALGRNPQKSRRTRGASSELRAPFLLANNLQEFVGAELRELVEPVQYRLPGESVKNSGYRAELLPLVCDVYLEARAAGRLAPSQVATAVAAEILVRALARVGIIALVDEATGYQEVRARSELQKILEAYVQAELRPWVRKFPDEFFREIYRLNRWEFKPGTARRTPQVGKLINHYIYQQLPPGVLDELRALNPVNEKGRRSHKHHQYLTADTGNSHLDKQIMQVTMLMRISDSKAQFEELFDRAFPPLQTRLPLEIPLSDLA